MFRNRRPLKPPPATAPGLACPRWGTPSRMYSPSSTRCWAFCIGSPASRGPNDPRKSRPASTAATHCWSSTPPPQRLRWRRSPARCRKFLRRSASASASFLTMAGLAECAMLNKGPHILVAMRVLDDILTRMQSHQAKTRSLLRALAAWTSLPKRLEPSRHGACRS